MPAPFKRSPNGNYSFRRRVPSDLVDVVGKEVITFSLKTKDPLIAKRLMAEELVRFNDDMARRREERVLPFDNLTVTKAKAFAGLWFQDRLEADAAHLLETDGEDLVDHQANVTAHEVALDQIERINLLPTRRRQTAMLAYVVEDVSQVEKLHSLRLEAGSVSHVRLAEEILSARSKVERVREARQRGRFDVAKKLAGGFAEGFPELPHGYSVVRQASRVGQPEDGVEAPLLTEVVTAYLDEKKLPVGTQMETNKTIRRFVEVHGDVSVTAVNKSMVRQWRALVEQLPKRQTALQKKMTIKELVADCVSLLPEQRLTFTSVNKDVSTLGTVLRFASDKWEFPDAWRCPTEGMKINRPRDQRKAKRKPFTDQDMRAIFSMSIYARGQRPIGGGGEAAKWMPILAAYTGARVGEIGQLCVKDVFQDSGVWCIDINEDDTKGNKNAGSTRRVALHSDLTDHLGFLQYVEQRGKAGDDPWLFNELKLDTKKTRTGSWGKFFGRVLREDPTKGGCGIEDRLKTFHSFRHAFKTKAREAGVPEDVHEDMTGHARASVGAAYGNRTPVNVQSGWLEKMDFSVIRATVLRV
tara:strand:+ start:81 stop:1829 length:1749 start_codon:yes stop_codon:yes gene_type:complete